MDFPKAVDIATLKNIYPFEIIGNTTLQVKGINEIHRVRQGDITFVDVEKYYKKALFSEATFIFINEKLDEFPEGKVLLYTPNPFEAYSAVVRHFMPKFEAPPAFQQVPKDSSVGEGTMIYPGAYIGHAVQIGSNCVIHPNVVIYDNVRIGDNVCIHANTTIGADAFYFKKDEAGHYQKMRSCGTVEIADDVEIGASCTIDRGVSAKTIIGRGTKLDNQIHIAHGVEIGQDCLIAACSGIAGKTIVEDNVLIWAFAGISKNLRIGKGAVVYARSGVNSHIAPGEVHFGAPSVPKEQAIKEVMALRRLPNWSKKINEKLQEIEEKMKNIT